MSLDSHTSAWEAVGAAPSPATPGLTIDHRHVGNKLESLYRQSEKIGDSFGRRQTFCNEQWRMEIQYCTRRRTAAAHGRSSNMVRIPAMP